MMASKPKKVDRSHSNAEHEVEPTSCETFNVHELLETFWARQMEKIKLIPADRFRDPHAQELPIARIKKIMKLDEEVKAQMISAEAPILLAKAAEMFIEELTLRAWVHTEDGKRKTLQKSDISKAVSKYDQFDFLIDIIPREEVKVGQVMDATSTAAAATANTGVTMGPEQMQYFLQLGGLTTSVSTSSSNALSLTTAAAATQSTIPQTVQLQGGQLLHATQIGQPIQLITGAGDIQQFITTDGSVQHTPIHLSAAQLQFLLKAQFGSQQRQGRQDGSSSANTPQTALFIQSGDDQQLTPLQVTMIQSQQIETVDDTIVEQN